MGLIYTGARVSELINIKIEDVDLDQCQIRINQGKGKKDRIVPFPVEFKEVLAMHVQNMKEKGLPATNPPKFRTGIC